MKSKNLLLLFFVLFSLAPCLLKGELMGTLDQVEQGTFNKTRATSPISCQLIVHQQSETKAQKKVGQLKKLDSSISGQNNEITNSFSTETGFSNLYAGNSPPKYILFKRLKIALV